ncbi:MAG TPA: LON peptidase substrate-binding domain-containing protein [Rhodocyclaceae bacterium]|nr:LON peptidase substrate-binding domain-containing protein [Rhodocyclaceae bacterium]
MNSPANFMNLPLFPLNAVLFPDGHLSLRVFEQRYMDMVSHAMRSGADFGICLIASGQEVGQPAQPHEIGTIAHIDDWDMPQLGMLNIKVHGVQRFRILERRTEESGLQQATVALIPNEAPLHLPDKLARLQPLMRVILADAGDAVPPPHPLDDAVWLGNRYAELLPISLLAKQKLMELDDSLLRVETIYQYLEQKGLLSQNN